MESGASFVDYRLLIVLYRVFNYLEGLKVSILMTEALRSKVFFVN